MATLLHSETRRLYSWWWDSHISPKNSKWLQENLKDMDSKVKAMIKLIEEDADSFAKRAEMYYKKRPELMKLVEEFYRAYRALAERYDHATGELRQAHRTMAEAFPNQVPFMLPEDSPSKSSEPPPELPPQIRVLLEPDDSQKDTFSLSAPDLPNFRKSGPYSAESDTEKRKRGLKQLHDLLEAGITQMSNSQEGRTRKVVNQENEQKEQSLRDELSLLSDENQNLRAKVLSESERAVEAEIEVQDLREALASSRTEKESVLLQYQQCLKKLSDLERELGLAQEDCMRLIEKSSRAGTEVEILRDALTNLEAERDAGILKHEESLKRISYLEVIFAQTQEKIDGLSDRAMQAETESQQLKSEISRLKMEKEAGLLQYNHCLLKISDLENKICGAEENARLLKEQADRAETEVTKLREALAALNVQKEASALQYKNCLEKIAKLEEEISCAQEDVKRVNNEVQKGAAELKNAEQKCALLEMSNQSLRLEADNLAKKIEMRDQELSSKQEELEELQNRVQAERLRYAQIEVTLHSLQNLHCQSQEDQRALAMELKNGLQMLKDLEKCKHGLEDEIQRVRNENHCLTEQTLSSEISKENLQNEIRSLREMKERLEEVVAQQLDRSNFLQQEILTLREEIKVLHQNYQSLVVQVESVGLKPEQLDLSVKNLQDENLKLKEICEKASHEKEALCKKLENMGELLQKNALLESSISAMNSELEGTHEKMRALQESCQFLKGEKSSLVAEKASVLSQLQILTENMQKLLGKNAVLENSLLGAKVEIEGLREKSNGLEEICKLLKSEKKNLQAERSALTIQLEHVEQRLEYLEKRFTGLGEKCAGLEKEKEATQNQVQELRLSLVLEKQERTSFALLSETRFASMENHVHLLQEGNCWKKKEFEEELDKAVKAQFEIYVLEKFIKDMEDKNYALLVECQKHVETSNLADKLISELESENLEQQVEAELLLDEIEKLRLDIYQIFQALETGQDNVSKDKVVNEQIFVSHILENIGDMKCCLSEREENNQRLLVENSVLLTLLRQLKLEGMEVESQKTTLEQEFRDMVEKLMMVQNDKHELLEFNRQLKLEVIKGDQHVSSLQSQLGNLSVKQGDLQEAYVELQKQYSQVLEENRSLLKKISSTVEEKDMLERDNDVLLLETLALSNLSTVYTSSAIETRKGLDLLSKKVHNLKGDNVDLKTEISLLIGRLEMREAENKLLEDSVQRLETALNEIKESHVHLEHEISSTKDILRQREVQLFEEGQRLETAENLNSELCKAVDELKTECQESEQMRETMEKQIMELSQQNISQNTEIECLWELNRQLESEVGKLREEIQEQLVRGGDLTSRLDEKNNESELWEAEAATFYFDLQISSIREALYENKVHELTGVCEILEDESASKTVAVQQMKETISSMDREIEGLKSQLDSYGSVVASLGNDVASLERNAFHQIKLEAADNPKEKYPEAEIYLQGSCSEKLSPRPNGIQDLQALQTRIKAVEKVVVKELQRHVSKDTPNSYKLVAEAPMNEIEELTDSNLDRRNMKHKLKSSLGKEPDENIKPHKAKLRASDGIQMKDIPLDQVSNKSIYKLRRRNNLEAGGSDDQMLELWETSLNSNRDRTAKGSGKPAHKPIDERKLYDQFVIAKRTSRRPSAELEMEKELGVDKQAILTSPVASNQEINNRKILERLATDAEKLAGLQTIVNSLRRNFETNKKRRKSRDIDMETVKEQLQEVEETITYLYDLNTQLTRTTEAGSPCSGRKASADMKDAVSIRQKRISEQTRKESEKISRLQLEVQKLQYVLLKLDEEKKSKVRTRFSRSKTTIIIRDFIYSRNRDSGKRKKAQLCGCFKPSSSRDGHRVSYS